jgi:predicted glycosyltransferase
MQWQVFSKHSKKLMGEKNVTIQPIDNDAFVASMASCEGVLCGAGFETPAEALFMKKKLMVIPMKGQYEQQCNAAALKKMGVPVLKSLKPENISKIDAWIKEGDVIEVDYPDFTEEIINRLIALHADAEPVVQKAEVEMYSVKKFRNLVLKKIVAQL